MVFGAEPRRGIAFDLVIFGGTVVTVDKERRRIEDGAVAIKGDKITAVGARAEITKNYKAKKTINAAGKVVIPGLINTHTQIPMTLFRGIADDLVCREWLTN